MKRFLYLFSLLGLTACGPRYPYVTIHGTVSDSVTGARLTGVLVQDVTAHPRPVMTNDSGVYTLRGVTVAEHAIRFELDGYRQREIIFTGGGEESVLFLSVQLPRIPDTAYTIHGPVDASFLLSDSLLQRKKLSKNEAKRIVLREIDGGKILGADLVQEDRRHLWIFDIQQGKNVITVVLDAYTAKVISIETSNYRSTDDW